LVSFSSSFVACSLPPLYLHSFPTRRSSDLIHIGRFVAVFGSGSLREAAVGGGHLDACVVDIVAAAIDGGHAHDAQLVYLEAEVGDRKSTRLNSSHVSISYAVFCLKKKKHRN